MGDPIEARALGTVLCEGRKENDRCSIGSVKTNIGHLEPAAGAAGIIKVALAMKHGAIPPNLHFNTPNPDIPFDELKLKVQQKLEPWKPGTLALAGVNSFGFGGANAHVIVQQAPHAIHQVGQNGKNGTNGHASKNGKNGGAHPRLVPLAARSSEGLKAVAQQMSAALRNELSSATMNDICYTTSLRRTHHDYRLAVVANDKAELIEALEAFAAGEARTNLAKGRRMAGQSPKVVFVCSGQGPQWWAMGRQLYNSEPVFRNAIEQCDDLIRQLGPWSLVEELTRDEASSRMDETSISQPCIFAMQVALARVWQSWGIEPSAVVGHSVGEVAAAYLAGALSLEDAVKTIYHRGRCMDFANAHGKMLAVSLPLEEAEALIEPFQPHVSLAANNSPTSVTLSGDGEALEQIAKLLEERNVWNKFLRVQYAFHSAQMEPMKDELLSVLSDIRPMQVDVPLYATVTGKPTDGTDLDAHYWWRNVRGTVCFASAIDGLLEEGYQVFLELAPHPVLSGSINESVQHRRASATVLHSLRRGDNELATMLKALGGLHAIGVNADWESLNGSHGHLIRLPAYPWQRERYWNEAKSSVAYRTGPAAHPLLGRKQESAQPCWQSELDRRVLSYLDDHLVQGHALLSATSFLEMALAAARQLYGPGALMVDHVEFAKACFLPEDAAIDAQVIADPKEFTFEVFSRPEESDEDWMPHAGGKVRLLGEGVRGKTEAIDAIRSRCATEVDADEAYTRMREMGLQYGPTFRGVERMWCGDHESLGHIVVPEGLAGTLEKYEAHPALLDACFQCVTGAIPRQGKYAAEATAVYLPVEMRQVRLHGPLRGSLWSHCRLLERDSKQLVCEVLVYSEQGELLAEVLDFRCQKVDGGASGAGEDINDLIYDYKWQLAPRENQRQARRTAGDLPSPSAICDVTEDDAVRLHRDLGLLELQDRLTGDSNRLCAAFIAHAFEKLGANWRVGDRFTEAELCQRMNVAKQHVRLMNRLLSFFVADRNLELEGDTYRVLEVPQYDDPTETWKSQVARNAAFYAELTLLGRCGQNLAGILRGEVDPLHLIFPDGSLSVAEMLYQDSPTLRFYNTLAQWAVGTVVDKVSKNRPLRLLEIGAGTGGMSSYVLPRLPADRTCYVYTDLSNHFFNKAEKKFAEYPFIEYKRLDIEQDPIAQGFEPHSFDMILASECLHATTDLRHTIRNCTQLLSSEGLLLMIEAVKPPRWVDLVFGLTDGWWRFSDLTLRPTYPLLKYEQWKSLLEEFAYSDVRELSGGTIEKVENGVIVARAPQQEAAGAAPEAESPETQAAQTQRQTANWLIYADRSGVAEKLAQRLEARGDRCAMAYCGDAFRKVADDCFELAPGSPEDVRRLLEETEEAGCRPLRGVVHLWNLDLPRDEQQIGETLAGTMSPGSYSLVPLSLALGELDAAEAPRLWLVTSGAQSVSSEVEETNAVQASAWGMGRVIVTEVPKLRAVIVDLSRDIQDIELDSLVAEFDGDTEEDSIALRGDVRYGHRYVHSQSQDTAVNRQMISAGAKQYRLETGRPGMLDKLILREVKREKCAPGEVEIQVCAAALNFADTLKALGLYPGLPDGPVPFGIECAGRVASVGEGVEGFKEGDAVVAVAPFCFAGYVRTKAIFVAHKPKSMTFEEAATMPVAFLTAHYAMNYLGRMSKGEKILIHAATGGVGLAAIQLAKLHDAEIFCTAGTPEKREFLASLGIEHIMDSRTLSFADQVLEATGGEGVDLVLNSLAGEAIRKGLETLTDYGRFLEIGKRDIYGNSRVGLRPFRKNLSMHVIDLDAVMRQRPEMLGAMFQELMQWAERGEIRPLLYRVFPISNVIGAFRYMAQAKHLGKIVLSMQEREIPVAPPIVGEVSFRADATYLMTGGLGGFGLTVAQWMVEKGARHLVLTGRSGAKSPEAQAAVEAMRNSGAEVVVLKADVTDRAQVRQVLDQIKQSMPPLKGVFHAAMVLKDCLMMNLTEERFREVWEPKVLGAWNLHVETQDLELDSFVLFSSLASIFGTGGQGNYASGNAFVDSLAYYRQARGLPALTISWGFLGQVGWVARHDDIAKRLEHQGVNSFTPQQALALFGRFIQTQPAHVGVMNMDWRKWGESLGRSTISTRFRHLVQSAGSGDDDSQKSGSQARAALLAASGADRRSMLENLLREQVARVLGASPAKLDVERPLTELGLDSLMAVELRNWIEGDLRLSLPAVELMRGPSVSRLTDLLGEQLGGTSAAPAAAAAKPAPTDKPVGLNGSAGLNGKHHEPVQPAANVEDLSEEEVDALLEQMAADQKNA